MPHGQWEGKSIQRSAAASSGRSPGICSSCWNTATLLDRGRPGRVERRRGHQPTPMRPDCARYVTLQGENWQTSSSSSNESKELIIRTNTTTIETMDSTTSREALRRHRGIETQTTASQGLPCTCTTSSITPSTYLKGTVHAAAVKQRQLHPPQPSSYALVPHGIRPYLRQPKRRRGTVSSKSTPQWASNGLLRTPGRVISCSSPARPSRQIIAHPPGPAPTPTRRQPDRCTGLGQGPSRQAVVEERRQASPQSRRHVPVRRGRSSLVDTCPRLPSREGRVQEETSLRHVGHQAQPEGSWLLSGRDSRRQGRVSGAPSPRSLPRRRPIRALTAPYQAPASRHPVDLV